MSRAKIGPFYLVTPRKHGNTPVATHLVWPDERGKTVCGKKVAAGWTTDPVGLVHPVAFDVPCQTCAIRLVKMRVASMQEDPLHGRIGEVGPISGSGAFYRGHRPPAPRSEWSRAKPNLKAKGCTTEYRDRVMAQVILAEGGTNHD